MDTLDSLERRDPWRAAWQALTSDVLLAALVAVVLIIGLALALLPQTPAAADALAVNRWRAEAQLRLGGWFTPLDAFGLNDVRGTPWLRLPVLALAAMAALRIADRAARLRTSAAAGAFNDGARLRVTDQAPSLADLQAALYTRRYRTQATDDALHATRAPLAEAGSIVLHLGLLLAAVGLLINIVRGWDVDSLIINSTTPAVLHGAETAVLQVQESTPQQATLRLEPSGDTLTLQTEQSGARGDLRITLRRIAPGYRIRAAADDGRALAIRTSNYLSPTESAAVDFGMDEGVTIAVPEAQLVLTLLHMPNGAPDELRAYSIGTAKEIASAQIKAQQMSIGRTHLTFEPLLSIELDAHSRPGDALALVGAVLALAGLLSCVILPTRRMTIRRSGPWTEFYADGRGVHADVQAMLRVPPTYTSDSNP